MIIAEFIDFGYYKYICPEGGVILSKSFLATRLKNKCICLLLLYELIKIQRRDIMLCFSNICSSLGWSWKEITVWLRKYVNLKKIQNKIPTIDKSSFLNCSARLVFLHFLKDFKKSRKLVTPVSQRSELR